MIFECLILPILIFLVKQVRSQAEPPCIEPIKKGFSQIYSTYSFNNGTFLTVDHFGNLITYDTSKQLGIDSSDVITSIGQQNSYLYSAEFLSSTKVLLMH